jgi:hypothetical protein
MGQWYDRLKTNFASYLGGIDPIIDGIDAIIASVIAFSFDVDSSFSSRIFSHLCDIVTSPRWKPRVIIWDNKLQDSDNRISRWLLTTSRGVETNYARRMSEGSQIRPTLLEYKCAWNSDWQLKYFLNSTFSWNSMLASQSCVVGEFRYDLLT